MADEIVLDSSAFLALLYGERGAERVRLVMDRAIISTINLAEVQTKLVNSGLSDELAWQHIASAQCTAIPFDDRLARLTGSLVESTRPLGLSLGERACVALGIHRKATVYTAEHIWAKLDLGIRIEVIRSASPQKPLTR